MNNAADNHAFSALVGEHRNLIFRICHSYCSNKADVEDLAQEMTYQLWRSYGSYDSTQKFTTWMYRIALNVAISFYRKEKKASPTLSLDDETAVLATHVEAESPDDDRLRLLEKFIAELKPLDRALMILYLDGKPYREIADVLGITETNTATKINRIKLSLKQRFLTAKIH